MKSFAALLTLLALFVGAAMAFIRPAQPVQMEAAVAVAAPGGLAFVSTATDLLLDNPAIEADSSINPARKCGFCMGVSANCYHS